MKKLETRKCACGCGATITRRYFEHPKSYIRGHHLFGSRNPRWNNGRYTESRGYVFLHKPNHPNADKRGYVRESVFVMSQHLERPIQPNEVIHHINGVRDDNRLENLVCITRSKHNSIHHKGLSKPSHKASKETKRKMSLSQKARRKREATNRQHDIPPC